MNRASIFVLWEKDGKVRDFIIYYLEGLKKVSSRIVVVVNGKLSAEGRDRLEKIGAIVLVRENVGVDFWAYKTGLDNAIDNIGQYDEIILANCSCYGPIYPFEEMFNTMQNRECDFWGITEWPENAGGHKGTWILSYFMVFRKKVFMSYEWKKYWKNLDKVYSREECIEKHEKPFTAYFADKGFTYDVYCKNEPYYVDMTIESPDSLVIKQHCPIIKRKVFCSEYSRHLDYQRGDVGRKVFDYIREHELYDTNMILDDMLETQNYYHIKNSLHLNYFLPSNYIVYDHAKKPKIALCFHVYYEDLIDTSLMYMKSMPEYADIYITTSNDKLYPMLEEKCKENNIINVKSIRYINARGRAESAFLVATKSFIKNYDYACIVHDKLTARITPTIIGKEFGLQNLDALLKTKNYVENIIGLFEKEPRLGMLEPVNTIHSIYGDVTYGFEWSPIKENYLGVKKLLEKMKISVPISYDIPPVCPMGAMFWVRPKAMEKLIDLSWEYEDFPEEPLPPDGSLIHVIERVYPFVVQGAGYLTGWVSTIEDAEVHLTNIAYKYRNLRAELGWGNCNIYSKQEVEQKINDMKSRESEIVNMYVNSSSWKITRWWRAIGDFVKKIKK